MRKTLLRFILTFIFFNAFPQALKKEQQKLVSDFIYSIKKGQWEQVTQRISYPLKREAPVPAIKDKKEFLKRYSEVFDNGLIKMITNSNPAVDWSAMG